MTQQTNNEMVFAIVQHEAGCPVLRGELGNCRCNFTLRMVNEAEFVKAMGKAHAIRYVPSAGKKGAAR